jgi:hypothetical protein
MQFNETETLAQHCGPHSKRKWLAELPLEVSRRARFIGFSTSRFPHAEKSVTCDSLLLGILVSTTSPARLEKTSYITLETRRLRLLDAPLGH